MKQLEAAFPSHPSHQVLVVDDDATSRYLIKVVLSQANYEVAEASGGIEGLRMARELSPALIVLDLVMDDLSGFEVLEQLSADPATRSIPVVIHTSKDLNKEEQARLSAAIDIVPKTVMNSRESALASFSEAFRKAGLTLVSAHDQVVATK
jgi:CheY-like chemotaxis protein